MALPEIGLPLQVESLCATELVLQPPGSILESARMNDVIRSSQKVAD
jgi:hypothetical protein